MARDREQAGVKTILAALALCGLVFAGNASAAGTVTAKDRFELWNNCEPLALAVQSNFEGFGIPKERFETAIRNKLQAHDIYTMDVKNAFLVFQITINDLKTNKEDPKGKMFSSISWTCERSKGPKNRDNILCHYLLRYD